MAAGKTTMLLQAAYNYEERGMAVRLLTAAVDDRHGTGQITSRIGLKRDAHIYTADTVMDDSLLADGVHCLFIDEAQFLTETQAQQLHRLAHRFDVPILCYGLRSDFTGQAFPGAATLLTLADELEEVKTICSCGSKASMNARLDGQGNRQLTGEQIQIGGNARYRSMCPRCFYEGSGT